MKLQARTSHPNRTRTYINVIAPMAIDAFDVGTTVTILLSVLTAIHQCGNQWYDS